MVYSFFIFYFKCSGFTFLSDFMNVFYFKFLVISIQTVVEFF